MKKGKIVLWVILCLLLVLVSGAFIYCLPRWRSAVALQENVDVEHFAYTIDLKLEEEALPHKTMEAIQALSRITGYAVESFYDLQVTGNVWEDKIYAQISVKGTDEAILELFLSEDADIVNATMLYDAFRKKLVGDSMFLDGLVPAMEEGVYMTLEQTEKMLGVDLKALKSLAIDADALGLSRQKYFLLLLMMSRKKQTDGNCYTFTYDTAKVQLAIASRGDFAAKVYVSMENPADVMKRLEDKLAFCNVQVPSERLDMFESIAISVKPGEGKEPIMPTEIVSDETIALLAELRALIEQFNQKK